MAYDRGLRNVYTAAAPDFKPQPLRKISPFGVDYMQSCSEHLHDMDGDGDLDVVTIAFTEQNLMWYENPGAGNYGPDGWKGHLLADTEMTCVLTSGGHNAGIVSEPGHPHRHFQISTRSAQDKYLPPDVWQASTPSQEGSWWPSWQEWLVARSGAPGAPPAMGAAALGYPPMGDAPGTYVLMA